MPKRKTKTLKTFRVGIWQESGAHVNVAAKTEEQAWDIAQAILDEHGIEGFPDFDITHRDCHILDCEEAKP